jgi:hypothetical protein
MSPKPPPSFTCKQCERIVLQMQDAWTSDLQELRTRLEDIALSSGRDLSKLGISWIFSIAEMPDDEMQALLQSHYPRVAEARRSKERHEAATGHSITLHGPWTHHPYGSADPT